MNRQILAYQTIEHEEIPCDLTAEDCGTCQIFDEEGCACLTELFCDYSEEISKNQERLLGLAASFGQGLQMTNILKDVWEDHERGACWLPQDVFENTGFNLRDLSVGTYMSTFGEGLAQLIGIAHSHLKNALSYTLLMPRQETGIRKFCLWAIGMAVLTLQNLNKTRNYTSGQDVKISKKKVTSVILMSNVFVRSNFLLKAFFKFAARDLPVASPTICNFRPLSPHLAEDRPFEYQSSAD